MSEQTTPTRAPRTRWGAIIWGVVFAGLAGWALSIVVDPMRRTALVDALAQVSPFTVAMWVLIAVGGLVLIGGIVALVRRGQMALADRRTADSPAADDTLGLIEKPHDTLTEDVVIPH